jgi:hypothetical protein
VNFAADIAPEHGKNTRRVEGVRLFMGSYASLAELLSNPRKWETNS